MSKMLGQTQQAFGAARLVKKTWLKLVTEKSSHSCLCFQKNGKISRCEGPKMHKQQCERKKKHKARSVIPESDDVMKNTHSHALPRALPPCRPSLSAECWEVADKRKQEQKLERNKQNFLWQLHWSNVEKVSQWLFCLKIISDKRFKRWR